MITDLNAAALSEAIHARKVSCHEVMAAYLDRIDEQNPAVNAIVSRRDSDELLADDLNGRLAMEDGILDLCSAGLRTLAGLGCHVEPTTIRTDLKCTLFATFAGLPAISVPVGFDERGLPMGMQLIGRSRADVDVLRLAAVYETTLAFTGVGPA